MYLFASSPSWFSSFNTSSCWFHHYAVANSLRFQMRDSFHVCNTFQLCHVRCLEKHIKRPFSSLARCESRPVVPFWPTTPNKNRPHEAVCTRESGQFVVFGEKTAIRSSVCTKQMCCKSCFGCAATTKRFVWCNPKSLTVWMRASGGPLAFVSQLGLRGAQVSRRFEVCVCVCLPFRVQDFSGSWRLEIVTEMVVGPFGDPACQTGSTPLRDERCK